MLGHPKRPGTQELKNLDLSIGSSSTGLGEVYEQCALGP